MLLFCAKNNPHRNDGDRVLSFRSWVFVLEVIDFVELDGNRQLFHKIKIAVFHLKDFFDFVETITNGVFMDEHRPGGLRYFSIVFNEFQSCSKELRIVFFVMTDNWIDDAVIPVVKPNILMERH